MRNYSSTALLPQAACAADRLAELHNRFGQIFTQVYATSETVGTATALPPHYRRLVADSLETPSSKED
jgi:hypothetical protein